MLPPGPCGYFILGPDNTFQGATPPHSPAIDMIGHTIFSGVCNILVPRCPSRKCIKYRITLVRT